MSTNLTPDQTLSREHKEFLLKQKGEVLWFCGLSGSGKSTIAAGVEQRLYDENRFCVRLDGDNLRIGLNQDLGFSDQDRLENIRRTAEVARILVNNGALVLCSLITPQKIFRDLARKIIGDDYSEIYVKASYEECAARDPKGLYLKASDGMIPSFTGRDSSFEAPERAELTIDTETSSIDEAVGKVMGYLNSRR